MVYRISEIEGVGLNHAQKFEKAGITTTEHLLEKSRDTQARTRLAASTGIREVLLNKWMAMADLLRVKGIGKHYSELLFAAGVDSTKKLLECKPEELLRKMVEQNKAKKLSGGLPKLTAVEEWVSELRTPQFAPAKK